MSQPSVTFQDGKPVLNTDTEGAQRNETPAPAPIDWGSTIKRVLAGAVVLAGAGAALFPPHTIAHQVCVAILGLGGLGITSQGNAKK